MEEPLEQEHPAPARAGRAIRWIWRLALLHVLLLLPWLVLLGREFRHLPEPRVFEPRSEPGVVVDDAEAMRRHLDEHPGLALFGDRWYFDRIHKSIVDPREGETASWEARSTYLVRGYGRIFETHRVVLRYFAVSALIGLFAGILVWARPGIPAALLLLFSSLAAAPQLTTPLAGRNLQHLFPYSLPQIGLALAILVLSVVAFLSRRLEGGRPEARQAWHDLMWGAVSLLAAGGGMVWMIAAGGTHRLQALSGLGALIFYGGWFVANGIRALLWERRGRVSAG